MKRGQSQENLPTNTTTFHKKAGYLLRAPIFLFKIKIKRHTTKYQCQPC